LHQELHTCAVTQEWGQELLYAFPPFCLIGQCLQKGGTSLINSNPNSSSLGYSTLVPNIIESTNIPPKTAGKGYRNPETSITLRHPSWKTHPLLQNRSLQLAAWLISGSQEKQNNYLKQLKPLSYNLEHWELETVTARPGKNSGASVVNGN